MDVVDRWTGRLAVALQQALRLTNEQFAEDLGCATRTVAKWHERSDVVLSEASQQFLDCVLEKAEPAVRRRFGLLAGGSEVDLPGAARAIVPSGIDDQLMQAAIESSADALLRAGYVGPEVLPELVQQVMRTSRAYDSQSRMVAFQHARATRDLAVGLTNTTRRPKELVELYAAAGQTNALMASLAFDLGRWDCSRQLAASASTYADLAGHDSLAAWTRGLEATLAFWSGDGDLALERINAGLAIAPAGEPRFRLLHIAARAHAVRGNRDDVGAALLAAEDERALAEQRGDDLHHGVGGEFAFDAARASACAGAAWLRVGDGVEAVRCARLSLELAACADVPPSAGVVCGVGIDLASALLMDGQLDGAAAMLAPVLSREPEFGNMSLGSRLATARGLLIARNRGRDPAAARLADEIEGWLAGTGIPVQRGK